MHDANQFTAWVHESIDAMRKNDEYTLGIAAGADINAKEAYLAAHHASNNSKTAMDMACTAYHASRVAYKKSIESSNACQEAIKMVESVASSNGVSIAKDASKLAKKALDATSELPTCDFKIVTKRPDVEYEFSNPPEILGKFAVYTKNNNETIYFVDKQGAARQLTFPEANNAALWASNNIGSSTSTTGTTGTTGTAGTAGGCTSTTGTTCTSTTTCAVKLEWASNKAAEVATIAQTAYNLATANILSNQCATTINSTFLSNAAIFASNTAVFASNATTLGMITVDHVTGLNIPLNPSASNRSKMVEIPNGNIYYIDTDGTSKLIKDTAGLLSARNDAIEALTTSSACTTKLATVSNAAFFASNAVASSSTGSINASALNFASNTAWWASNQLQNVTTSALSAAGLIFASNTAGWASNTALPFSCNAAVFASNTAQTAMTMINDALAAVGNTGTSTTFNITTDPSFRFSCNAALFGSNTAYYASNTAYYASNTAYNASNTAYYASNTAYYASNELDKKASLASGNFSSNTSFWCSNQIYYILANTDFSGTATTSGITQAELDATLEWYSNQIDILGEAYQDVNNQMVDVINTATIASNVSDWCSNQIDTFRIAIEYASNAADFASNAADFASNAADFASNTVFWCSNQIDVFSSGIEFASNMATSNELAIEWCSNALTSQWDSIATDDYSALSTACNVNIGPADVYYYELNVNASQPTSTATIGVFNAPENFVILESGASELANPAITFGSYDTIDGALTWKTSTTADLTTREDTELMRLTTSGKLGIGTLAPLEILHVTGNALVEGDVKHTGALMTVSDERLKVGIDTADTSKCYDIVKAVELKQFAVSSSVPGGNNSSEYGWIAQDLESIDLLPESVSQQDLYDIPDCRLIRKDQIYAVMYGAIQQLHQKVETLEAALAAV